MKADDTSSTRATSRQSGSLAEAVACLDRLGKQALACRMFIAAAEAQATPGAEAELARLRGVILDTREPSRALACSLRVLTCLLEDGEGPLDREAAAWLAGSACELAGDLARDIAAA